ncbi:hypothetical protein NK8_03250 [Caballeronia sp. NK8]|uniref:hypothetical protein n=1 Tax=Caballeronia sp. NK8 TaxID=140098 RepID=UPI001BB7E78E|nr:hypothetical protein [Caballeronia sp. NK8]BCQ22216.1 hypothetical protein NK8_03250 [Caballeronia sp. NK8]
MPLYDNGLYLIQVNLEELQQGRRVLAVPIGRLTSVQHQAVNSHRLAHELPKLGDPEIVFIGRHVHESRIVRDSYSVGDVLTQITSALDAESVVVSSRKMTALDAPVLRTDGYGNEVRDRAILELTQRKPRAELFSVIPKGDIRKPPVR